MMPLTNSVEENLRIWNLKYQWPQDGDEWSGEWGNPHLQWSTSILPRIRAFLPADTILEIAPGHGRWSELLKNECKRLLLVDLSPDCIDFCRKRFSGFPHVEYYVNDGVSLAMIEDASIDFVFSFDSLVHAEAQVMRQYVTQLSRKLRPGGAAFIHHSNAGRYRSILRPTRRLARLLKRVPTSFLHDHWRSLTMTARQMRSFCDESGLVCVTQELVPFERTLFLIDSFTTLRLPADRTEVHQARIFSNWHYGEEARLAKRLWTFYGRGSSSGRR